MNFFASPQRVKTAASRALAGACLLASASAWAQAWPASDCATLLAAGQPRPVWGSKEKPDQTTLLTLINYQLAISLCQQEEISKSLREQRLSTKEAARLVPLAPKATAAPAAMPSKEPLAELLRDALSKEGSALGDASKSPASILGSPPSEGVRTTVGGVTVTVRDGAIVKAEPAAK